METQLKLAMMNDELGQARTSKKEFLDKIESIIPWDKFIEIIEPCYYKGERGNVRHKNLNRWFFYVYYPAHMVVLLVIQACLKMLSQS